MLKKTWTAALLIVVTLSVAAAATATAATTEKFLTATGAVAKLDAAERTVFVKVGGNDTRFVWTADTKINGTLTPGANVTIKYTMLPDGQNLAHQITVSKN